MSRGLPLAVGSSQTAEQSHQSKRTASTSRRSRSPVETEKTNVAVFVFSTANPKAFPRSGTLLAVAPLAYLEFNTGGSVSLTRKPSPCINWFLLCNVTMHRRGIAGFFLFKATVKLQLVLVSYGDATLQVSAEWWPRHARVTRRARVGTTRWVRIRCPHAGLSLICMTSHAKPCSC